MMCGSIVSEGAKPYMALGALEPAQLHNLVFAILLSCVNAVILNLAQLYVTKHLGAVGGQLVSQAKMVLTVLGGMVLFGESFSQLETLGFAMALCGVYTFTRMDQAFKAREKAKQEALKGKDSVPSYNAAAKATKVLEGK